MAEIIINQEGEIKSIPVNELDVAFEQFKQSLTRPDSRFKYRRERNEVVGADPFYYLHEFLTGFAKRADKMPKRGTREYDEAIDKLWRHEPILAGTVYGMVAKAQSKPWRIEGGRNNTTRAARLLADAKFSYYKAGWAGFAGVSALDFYTTRIGFVWAANRRGNKQYGTLSGLEHVDAHSCRLTGSWYRPVRYHSAETGQVIRFKQGEVIQENSMTIGREQDFGYGFCAVERALIAVKLLIGLHDYDIEKLSNLPPEGIAAISGMTYDEFMDSMTNWLGQRESDNSLTFPQILFLLNEQLPAQGINVELTPFSTLPEQFDRQTVVIQYVNILANCFGVSASDIWFMGGGPFSTGTEVEMQHTFARGKGEGEWFSLTEQVINRELPPDVEFSYDTKDIGEDLIAAQTAKAWVEVLLPLVEQSQNLGIDSNRWRTLLVEKGVLPEWMITTEGQVDRTLITADQTQRMKEDSDAFVAFLWEAGRVHERPVLTVYRQAKDPVPEPSRIRGKPIPEGEAERGTRITRKAIEAEQEIWRGIPELAVHLEQEANEAS